MIATSSDGTAALLSWTAPNGTRRRSLVCKRTFDLAEGRSVPSESQEALTHRDVLVQRTSGVELVRPSDLVPLRPGVDVLVVGFAPHEAPPTGRARLSVGSLDKTMDGATLSASGPFPLGAARSSPAQFVDGFSDVVLDADTIRLLSVAPADQVLGGAVPVHLEVLLEHIVPGAPRLSTSISLGEVWVAIGEDDAARLPLRPDTILFDVDRAIVCVTWRTTLGTEDLSGRRSLLVRVDGGGDGLPRTWLVPLDTTTASRRGSGTAPGLSDPTQAGLALAGLSDPDLSRSDTTSMPATPAPTASLPFFASAPFPLAPPLGPPAGAPEGRSEPAPASWMPPAAGAAAALDRAPAAPSAPPPPPPLVIAAPLPAPPQPPPLVVPAGASPAPTAQRAILASAAGRAVEEEPVRVRHGLEGGRGMDALGSSNAAADAPASARRSARAPEVLVPRGDGRPPFPKDLEPLEVLWIEPGLVGRLREDPALASVLGMVQRGLRAEAESDVPEDVARVLQSAPTSLGSSPAEGAVDARGLLRAPLVCLEGTLIASFDERTALEATIGALASSPLAGDRTVREGLDAAQAVVKNEWATTQALIDARRRLRESAQHLRDASSALDAGVDRALLEHRAFRRRTLLGANMLRMEWRTAQDESAPIYLPDDLTTRLPLFPRFAARVIAEVQPRQDAAETSAVALRARALARRAGEGRREPGRGT